MKKILTLLISIAILATMMVVPVSADQTPTIAVERIEEASVIEDEVKVAVLAENNPGFTSFNWVIRYDETRLKLDDFDVAPMPRSMMVVPNVDENRIVVTGLEVCDINDVLFYIVFKVINDAPSGQAYVEIDSEEIFNGETPVEFDYLEGFVNVDGIDEETGGSTTGGSTTGGSTTGGSTTGGSTTGGSTTGGSITGGAVTSLGSGSQTKCTVTFNLNEGTGTTKAIVNKGETLEKPEDPVREGFKFIGWYVDADLTKLYNFNTLVTGNFTLYAKWVEEEKEETQTGTGLAFTDVNENDWFYEAVKFAFEKSLINGVSDTEFAPNDKVTRAALVEILYRIEGKPATNKSIPYSDVAMDKYYADAVTWADQNEIIKGISETEFAPEVNITREQIATIIYRYAQYNNYDMSVVETTDLSAFNDADQISDYAVDAMKYAVGVGIINGRSNAMLAPKDYASRAEFVQILYNFFK